MSKKDPFQLALEKPVIRDLSKLFTTAKKELYIVGGTVRDIFLKREHEDLDFTTDALPDEIERIVKKYADEVWSIGKEYGTIGLIKNGLKVEITTFRSEIYKRESRKPTVTFSRTIEEDLKRRDFTINSMAIKLPEKDMVDPYGGLSDLGKKLIRTPQEPDKSFSDDPLRMLRAIRFVSMLGFVVEEKTEQSIKELASRLEIISKERIRDELSKLLLGSFAAEALRLLVDYGIDKYVVPELSTLKMAKDPKFHHKDVLEHTYKVVSKVEPELVIRLTALMHDIGKPVTKSIQKGNVHFYGHDVVGARMAKKRLRELRYPKKIVEDVSKLIRLHLRPYNYAMGWNDSAVRRYARDAGELLSRLNQLAVADCTSRIPAKRKRNLELIKDLEKRIKILDEEEEIAKIRPPIDGNEIMKALNTKPGPLIGEAYNMLLDAKLDDKIKTKEEAFSLLDKWAKDKKINK